MSIFKRRVAGDVVATGVLVPIPEAESASSAKAGPKQAKLSFTGDEFAPPMGPLPADVVVNVRLAKKQDLYDTSLMKVPFADRPIRYVDHYCPSLRSGWVDVVVESEAPGEPEFLLCRYPYANKEEDKHYWYPRQAASLVHGYFKELASFLVLGGGL